MALEFDKQLSLLQKPDKSEMTQEEFDLFEKNVDTMMENWGFINNLFKILPLNAKQYVGFLNFKASLFTPETCYLSNADKEMIGVVVSSDPLRAAFRRRFGIRLCRGSVRRGGKGIR